MKYRHQSRLSKLDILHRKLNYFLRFLGVAFLFGLLLNTIVGGAAAKPVYADPILSTLPKTVLLKPVESAKAAPMEELAYQEPPSVAGPQNASRVGAFSPNLYQPGQCVFGVKEWRPDIPGNWGSAYKWIANAQATGWPTGLLPKVGAVGAKDNHVVLVVSLNSDGSFVTKEMNQKYVPFQITSRTLFPAGWRFIY